MASTASSQAPPQRQNLVGQRVDECPVFARFTVRWERRRGENVNLTHIAEVVDIGRPLSSIVWKRWSAFAWWTAFRSGRALLRLTARAQSKYVIVDSGWLCGLLGFCSTAPSVISSDHPEVVRQLLTNWTWATLATLTDNDPDLHLWHFALRTGLSIDLILEDANTGSLTAFQISPKENVTESDFTSLVKFRDLVKDREVQTFFFIAVRA